MDRYRVIIMRGGEKWEGSRYILKIEPTEFSDVRYEIKTKIIKKKTKNSNKQNHSMTPGYFDLSN